MLTLEQIVEQLGDRRIDIVATAIGVRPSTLIDIKKGRTLNPSYETVKALSDYLSPKA